jgi:hypothetical protein
MGLDRAEGLEEILNEIQPGEDVLNLLVEGRVLYFLV